MDLLQAIILGLVQGVAEWLPVSSEGINSLILTTFYNQTLSQAAYLSIWLHMGTLLASIIYFRKLIIKLLKNLKQYSFKPTPENKLTNFLIISTFASAILGLPILLFGIDKLNFQGSIATALIGVLLIITGLLQLYIKATKHRKEPTKLDGFLVGIFQSLAGLPGLSRSGLTISALLFRDYEAKEALTLSFLMSIPVILGAELIIALTNKIIFEPIMLVAFVTTFITGLLTIKLLMRVAKKINFGYFCIIIGLISFIPLLL